MAKRKLLSYTRYRYGKRSFIYPGYRFRASGGPYFVGKDDGGKRLRIPMGETGVFVFRKYCEQGASKWIEATDDENRTVIIYVGRKRRSPDSGLILSPHKIGPIYERKRSRRSSQPRLVQQRLF